MTFEEAIIFLYQIAEEAQDDLNRNRRGYTNEKRIAAINVAISAIRREQKRELEARQKLRRTLWNQ